VMELGAQRTLPAAEQRVVGLALTKRILCLLRSQGCTQSCHQMGLRARS